MEEEEEAEPEEEVDYDDSTVLKYLCTSSSSSAAAASSAFFGNNSNNNKGPLKGFRVSSTAGSAAGEGPLLCDPALSAVYSLHLQPTAASRAAPLLAAGEFA